MGEGRWMAQFWGNIGDLRVGDTLWPLGRLVRVQAKCSTHPHPHPRGVRAAMALTRSASESRSPSLLGEPACLLPGIEPPFGMLTRPSGPPGGPRMDARNATFRTFLDQATHNTPSDSQLRPPDSPLARSRVSAACMPLCNLNLLFHLDRTCRLYPTPHHLAASPVSLPFSAQPKSLHCTFTSVIQNEGFNL
ncbi:hypothetical protein M758_4G269500 [Ceratodon purpureus]|nr:hypothetical protein M758_4G269500 [Ceratodon purpureus]